MKLIFCLLICFFTLNSAELLLKESHKINKDLKLNIYINNDEYEELGFKLLDKNDKVIYQDLELESYLLFEKLNKNFIFITKDSGGICCSSYVILEINEHKLKNVTNLDFGNCRINSIFVNKKNELEFTTHDCTFQNIKDTPELIFKNTKINIEKMKKTPPAENELRKMLEFIKKEKNNHSSILENFIVNLIYSGNMNSAFQLYNDYDKLFSSEKNITLLKKILINFKHSKFFKDILDVNNISLIKFNNLMKEYSIKDYYE